MLVEMNQLTVQSAKNLITIVIAFLIGDRAWYFSNNYKVLQ